MNRRNFVAGAAATLGTFPASLAAPKRPNIIVVLLDDLGYGQFEPNSDEFTLAQLNPLALEAQKDIRPADALEAARTAVPTFSRLAKEGTRFTDAYVACPLCAPSRSAIMTSRYPQRFGGYVNLDITRTGVPTSQLFPVQLLQKSGYATAAIGKWHLAEAKRGMEPGSGQHPLDRGFDYFFGFNSHGTSYYESDILMRNRDRAAPQGYLTEQFTDEALGFLQRATGKPFFMYLAYNAVHGPLNRPAPERYLKRFHTGVNRVDNFYAYLNAADEGVGRILKLLAQQSRDRDTLLLLLSDNGASGGSPVPSNGPFLGYKGQVWQGGVRVPLIAWGAGIAGGKVCREPVISMDIMPTALEAAGVRLPGGYAVDGRSLLPVLSGRQKGPVHETLFWAGQFAMKWAGGGAQGVGDELTAPPAWGVRKGRWLLRYWSHLKRYELYDMEIDKGERHEVSAEHPEIVRELKAHYAEWFKGTSKPITWKAEAWEILRASGTD